MQGAYATILRSEKIKPAIIVKLYLPTLSFCLLDLGLGRFVESLVMASHGAHSPLTFSASSV
jgi:hypothetical protein